MNSETYVVVLGPAAEAEDLANRIRDSKRNGYKLLGYFCSNGRRSSPGSVGLLPCLGTADLFKDYIFRNPVDMIVNLEPLGFSGTRQLVQSALEIGLTVALPSNVALRAQQSSSLKDAEIKGRCFLGTDMALLSTLDHGKSYLFVKRLLDVVLASILFVALLPLLLVIAVTIKISSPKDPILYPWRVLGKNAKPFVGYKFRTMVPNADQLKEQLLSLNEMHGPVFKMRNDPRITSVGRFLRKFSLDELPQLYSVIKGDMTLVGPRPPYAKEAERYAFWQRRKLCVKPGITCLWQVSGRNEITDFNEWVALDLHYIETASLLLDLKILLRTVLVVFQGRGAY